MTCECGCGEQPRGKQSFLPGHDQKLRIELERRVGGLLPMRAIVEACEALLHGNASADDLARTVRMSLNGSRRGQEGGAT
jgi:hypothetical protein